MGPRGQALQGSVDRTVQRTSLSSVIPLAYLFPSCPSLSFPLLTVVYDSLQLLLKSSMALVSSLEPIRSANTSVMAEAVR